MRDQQETRRAWQRMYRQLRAARCQARVAGHTEGYLQAMRKAARLGGWEDAMDWQSVPDPDRAMRRAHDD